MNYFFLFYFILFYLNFLTYNIYLISYLKKAFTPEQGIRKQDVKRVFEGIAKNNLGRDMAWDYVRNNWDYIIT